MKKWKKKTNQANRSAEKYPNCSLKDFCKGNPGSSGFTEYSFLTESFKGGTILILKSLVGMLLIVHTSPHQKALATFYSTDFTKQYFLNWKQFIDFSL